MQLYDQVSSITWAYGGEMTPEEMRKGDLYNELFEVPCVLYDNGAGKAYRFEPLETVCARWAVPYTGNPAQDFDSLTAAMDGTYKAPGVAEVEEKADAAQTTAATAQTTADEAKTTADTAAAGMNEYMDALLGLGATNETEAADAE